MSWNTDKKNTSTKEEMLRDLSEQVNHEVGAGTAEAMDRQSDEARDIVVKALETRAGATPKERAVVGSMFGLASAIVALVEATQQADKTGIDSPSFMGKLSQVLNLAFDSEVIKETRELIIKNATTNGEE